MKKHLGWVLLLAGMAQGATWTGKGDGTTWGDTGNWLNGTLPSATETATFSSRSGTLTLNLGSLDREAQLFETSGSGSITFTGTGKLTVGNISTTSVALDFKVPVEIRNDGNHTICSSLTTTNFRKPVTILGARTLTLSSDGQASSAINFHDTLTGAQATLCTTFGCSGSKADAPIHYYGKVTLAKLQCGRSYKSCWSYLHASSNAIAAVDVAYGGVVAQARDIFPETTHLTWNNYYTENNEGLYSYSFEGYDQTVEAIRNTWVASERDECRYVRSTTSGMTLTLKGRSDAEANCYIQSGVSLVWDPVGDYTQAFTLKASKTGGTITVNRGTVAVTNGATFAALAGITVAPNATFRLDTGKTGALAALMRLTIGAGGRMVVGATSADPFSNHETTAYLADGATIETAGAVTLNGVVLAGTKLAAGTYGAGGTAAAWVTGGGSVTVLGADTVSQEIRTWTGAGDGATWSDAANWDTGVPVSRDSALFTNSVALACNVAIWGAANATSKLEVASGKTVTLSGTLSGTPSLLKTGAGRLVLSGSNTFTGSLVVKAGHLKALGPCSLGDNASGAVEVVKDGETTSDNLELGGVTLRKELILRNVSDAANGYSRQFCVLAGTTNLILGKLTVPNSYLRSYCHANARFVIAGGGTFNTASFFDRAAGAEIIVTNKPIAHRIYGDDFANGKMVFAVAGCRVFMYNTEHTRGACEKLEVTVNDAWGADTAFYFGKSHGEINLNGTTQSISRIEALTKSASDWTPNGTPTIRSAAPAQLTYNWANTYTNSAKYVGDVSLVKKGAGTLFLTAASTSTGTLTAEAGTIVLCAGAAWKGALALPGGTIRVPDPSALGSALTLTLGNGTLDLGAGDYPVAALTDVDGNTLPVGRYAATASAGVTALAGVSGAGILEILPQGGTAATYTWKAGVTGAFTDAGNWEGETLPDFANARATYTFPGNGYTVTVDTNVFAQTFAFSGQASDPVRLVPGATRGEVTLIDGGLVVTGLVGTAKNVAFDVPLRLHGRTTFLVGDLTDKASNTQTLWITNRLDALTGMQLGKVGFGTWRLGGAANVINGDITISNGLFRVSGADPLGGTGTLGLAQPKGESVYTKIRLDGLTTSRPIWFTHPSDENGNMLISSDGTTNVLNGMLTCRNSHLRLRAGDRSEIRLRGGMALSAFFLPYAGTDGRVIIEETPITSGSWYWSDSEDNSTTVFAVPNNTFSTWNLYNVLRTEVDGVFAANATLQFNYRGKLQYGLLDLTDTRQSLGTCTRAVTTNVQGVVTSLANARVTGTSTSRLTLTGTTNVDPLPRFLDAATYAQAGTATRTFRTSNTSTGDLYVVNGTLVLEAPGAAYRGVAQNASLLDGGSWAGDNVVVSGGTLKINHGKALPRRCLVNFAETGKMEIPSGVEVVCGVITDDGVELRRGHYTAKTLPDHISGGGTLTAVGLYPSMAIILR